MRKKKEVSLQEMTIRDFIAMLALHGWISNVHIDVRLDGDFEGLSNWSYNMADAMMEARNGTN